MSEPAKPKIDPARLAALLDAGTIAAGIVALSLGVGLYDHRLGIATFGGLLLAAELVAALLRR